MEDEESKPPNARTRPQAGSVPRSTQLPTKHETTLRLPELSSETPTLDLPLTTEEEGLLDRILYQLRMLYVARANNPPTP